MNGYDRISAALDGRMPDRVPIMLHNFMMAAREAGVSMKQFRSDSRSAASAFIAAAETYGVDGILVDFDTATLAEALGVPIDLPDHEPARCTSGLLGDLRQIHDLPVPNIQESPRIQIWLETVRRVKDYFGDELFIRGNCDQCPFSLASMLRSPASWLMDLTEPENEDEIFAVLDYCLEAGTQFLELMTAAGADMLSGGDSPAGPEMISPAMYRQFASPYEKRLVEAAHRLRLPYALHICGNAGPILEDMRDTGADALEFDQKTDARLASETLRGRTTFFGNIDPSGVLALGTPSLVRERTLALLRTFEGNPRFVLNAGCAIPASTPAENVQAMIAAARGAS